MNDYVTLLGAESVQDAGITIRSAAERMSNAATSFYDTAQRLITALDEHATRIERAAEKMAELSEAAPR